jgi:hypothetical protein
VEDFARYNHCLVGKGLLCHPPSAIARLRTAVVGMGHDREDCWRQRYSPAARCFGVRRRSSRLAKTTRTSATATTEVRSIVTRIYSCPRTRCLAICRHRAGAITRGRLRQPLVSVFHQVGPSGDNLSPRIALCIFTRLCLDLLIPFSSVF